MRNAIALMFAAAVCTVFAGDLVYDVAETTTNTVTTSINADEANVSRLIKRGTGTLQLYCNVGTTKNFAEMIVEGGTVEISTSADCFKPTNVVIRAGASVLNTGTTAVFVSTTSFDIETGGFLSFGGVSDTIDGFRGNGVVSNKTAVSVTLNLAKGPYRFGGLVVGDSIFECAASSGDANAHKKLVVCSTNALANTRWRMGSGTVTNLVAASGLREMYVGQLQAGGSGRPVWTENEGGEPVTIYFNAYGYGGDWMQVRGRGTLIHRAATLDDHSMYMADEFDGFTGVLGCYGGSLCIGANDTPGSQPKVSGLSQIVNIPYYHTTRMQFRNKNCQTNYFNCTIIGKDYNSRSCTFDFIGPAEVERFETTGVLVNHYTNLLMKSGHLAVMTGGFQVKNAGCSFTILDGTFSSSRLPSSSASIYNYNWSKLLYPVPIAITDAHNTHFYVKGGEVDLKEKVPNTDVTDGGVFAPGAKIAANDSATVVNPTTIFIDGGTFRIKSCTSTYGFNVFDESDKIKIAVGAKGMSLENEAETSIWTDTMCYSWFNNPIYTGVVGGDDGGITRIGGGHFLFYKPLTITGPFRNLDGTLWICEKSGVTGATVPLLGSGEFEMANGAVRYDGGVTNDFTLKLGTVGGFRTSGAATFRLKPAAAKPAKVQLGSLTRERGSGVFLYSNIEGVDSFSAESSGKVSFVGGLEKRASGLVKAPVFTLTVPTNCPAGSLKFATYDDVNDCVAAFDGMTEGVNEGTVANVETAAVTVAAGTTVNVEALRVCGVTGVDTADPNKAPLWISGGATVKVGNGTDPACVIITSPTDARRSAIRGSGTLDFGTSEGVIAVNRTHWPSLGVKLAGSNGVTFLGPVDGLYETLPVSGTNVYTGGTVINGVSVILRNDSAFGSGTVRCGGGQIGGGRIWFDEAGHVLANNLQLEGYGPTRGDRGQWGALYFSKSGMVSGNVEILGKTRLVASGSNTVGTISGIVSGDRLQIWSPTFCDESLVAGDIVLTAPNTYTNGTEIAGAVLTLRDSGTIGTGDLLLDGGTLVIDKEEAFYLTNRVDGVGTIGIKSQAPVTVSNIDTEFVSGIMLGLGNTRCTVASLEGFGSVTNLLSAAAELYVLDGSDATFAGDVSANVTLHSGAYKPSGTVISVR